MLASIHPLGERARRNHWWFTTTAYLLGSTAGGAVLGALAGLVGAATFGAVGLALSPWIIAAICIVSAVVDLAGAKIPVPSWRRQVNEDWLRRYRGWVYGGGFGLQLGFGIVTVVTTVTVYAVVALAALTASVTMAAMLGAVFGIVRGLPLLTMAGVGRADQLRRVHAWLAAAAVPARRVASSALLVVATATVLVAR